MSNIAPVERAHSLWIQFLKEMGKSVGKWLPSTNLFCHLLNGVNCLNLLFSRQELSKGYHVWKETQETGWSSSRGCCLGGSKPADRSTLSPQLTAWRQQSEGRSLRATRVSQERPASFLGPSHLSPTSPAGISSPLSEEGGGNKVSCEMFLLL